jgi:subtilisin family serine protease
MLAAFLMVGQFVFSQEAAPDNWFNLDFGTDGVRGVSTEKMYKELLKNRKAKKTVVVAVIDSGVDNEHEDLKGVMWVNEDELPGNGIDDDKNGYVDDIHGWNFIGGKNGANIDADNLEITRLVRKYGKMFEGKDPATLSKADKKLYDSYKTMEADVKKEYDDAKQKYDTYDGIVKSLEKIEKQIGKAEITPADLTNIKTEDPGMQQAVGIATRVLSQGGSFNDLKDQLQGALKYFSTKFKYQYNVDYDPRSIVGDNYADPNERYYGNNTYRGPDASHGTHVAGIIAAARGNGVGMDGVADNVRIMTVRAVPDGDERDKDVANAIMYAVDNGADIINMSFGKSYSWNKEVVDKAVKYAQKHDVLMVHAAGNDGNNTDVENNFPTDKFAKAGLFAPKYAKNWLEIGALSWKTGEESLANFSNYGKNNVDLFSPGVDIYSTTPDQGYDSFNGTSMAAPVTAGVAAVIRSYFPELTAQQVKGILVSTTIPLTEKVKKPGSEEMVMLSDICTTGGVVNAYKAVKMAAQTKGKKKLKYMSGGGAAGKETKAVKP